MMSCIQTSVPPRKIISIYPMTSVHTKPCMSMSTAVLSIIASAWMWLRCSLRWMDQQAMALPLPIMHYYKDISLMWQHWDLAIILWEEHKVIYYLPLQIRRPRVRGTTQYHRLQEAEQGFRPKSYWLPFWCSGCLPIKRDQPKIQNSPDLCDTLTLGTWPNLAGASVKGIDSTFITISAFSWLW
jgi:hypothetical protein